jgi:hypothetical protein
MRLDAIPRVRPSNAIAAELAEAGQAGVIGLVQSDHTVATMPLATSGGGNLSGIPLSRLRATRVGRDLARLMRLERMPRSDVADVFAEIGGEPEHLPKRNDPPVG